MEDPLWRCMDSSKPLKRDNLELVIQKKKISDIYNWFHEHFVALSTPEYLARCPIVILQGPTGCGKTSTLKFVSHELKIPIKEYSDTSDVTAINYDISKIPGDNDGFSTAQSIDRRKAIRFEHFVINNIRYSTLYPPNEFSSANADSEFDSDDDFVEFAPIRKQPPPPVTGVIIHVDTPIIYSKSQRIILQSIQRLLKVIKEISGRLLRRVAIVFETLEGDSEAISLPTKVKTSLGIQVFKFNPIIRSNLKKLVESLLKNYKHITIDKETVDELVNDSDGDIRACLNTLQLICNKSRGGPVLNRINYNSLNGFIQDPLAQSPVSKKQKVIHERVRHIKLNPSLMRDSTRSLGFFHVLGKVFYQKRIYPETSHYNGLSHKKHRSIDRPFQTENCTENLVNMLDVSPKNLIAWLHQHYYKFCTSSIDKAALFLDNLSIVDTISLSSTQSSQFYESHVSLDQLQCHISIDSTVFSLYEDQSRVQKSSHKKVTTSEGSALIKSSVENLSSNGELYSFNKPVSMSLEKVISDYQTLLDCCTIRLMKSTSNPIESTKVLLDYVPYIKRMILNRDTMLPKTRSQIFSKSNQHPILDDECIIKILTILERLEIKSELDYENIHEKLMELIEDCEVQVESYRTTT